MPLSNFRLLVVIVTSAVIGGIAGSVVTATSTQNDPNEKVVKANKFVVVDSIGKELAVLGSNKAGTCLILGNKNASPLMFIGNMPDGAGIVMRNKSGRAKLDLSVLEDEDSAQIHMIGSYCKLTAGSRFAPEMITLYSSASQYGGFAVKDRKGVYRIAAGLGEHPYFYISSDKNKSVCRIEEKQDVLHIKMEAPGEKLAITGKDVIDAYSDLKKAKMTNK